MAEPAQLLFLYGNDEFAISRRLAAIQAQHDKEGNNTTHLDAASATQDELHKALFSMPFLASTRLAFLENPSKITSDPATRKKFLALLQGIPPNTLAVLHEIIEPRDLGKHWLIKHGRNGVIKIETFMLPRRYDMQNWILKETKRQKGQIDIKAASRLAEMTGEDTRQAAQEITKLLTYVNYTRPIQTSDIETLSVSSAEGNVFALVDGLADGDGKAAQKVLHQLLDTEDPAAIWGMVIRQFRLLLQAKEILDEGGNKTRVEEMLGLRDYEAGKISSQARRFNLPDLEKIYHRLLEIDEGNKTGQMTLDLALDILVIELSK